MNALEIMTAAIKKNEHDGLYNHDGCGCVLGDLAPCGGIQIYCVTGKKYTHSVNGIWIIASDRANYTDEQIMEIAG